MGDGRRQAPPQQEWLSYGFLTQGTELYKQSGVGEGFWKRSLRLLEAHMEYSPDAMAIVRPRHGRCPNTVYYCTEKEPTWMTANSPKSIGGLRRELPWMAAPKRMKLVSQRFMRG